MQKLDDQVVRYRVSMPHPHSHLYEVEAEFPPVPDPVVAALPVWTPGSYLVREFSRHLQDVSATADGAELKVTRIDKRSFQVLADGRSVRWRYRVYANELTVRTSHLDGSHGFFNGATLFLYHEAFRHRPHRVTLELPPGWQPFSALDRQADEFIAPNYDELIDNPFELGPHQPLQFTAAGVEHQIVVWGQLPVEASRITGDLKRICEAEAQLFGGLPIRRYLFILHLTDKGRGGLEHKGSTSLLFPRAQLATPKGWEDFLSLVAHEYFHLWNIKRIKPKRLHPYDYGRENYTESLWAFEGATSYYDTLLVRRAGLMGPARFLTRLGESLTSLHSTPGRKVQSLAEASLTAWIKFYRPDENTPNSAISYYLKGEIVSALLDLEIRRSTGNRKSLDEVMRTLWQRYGDERGIPEDGVERISEEVAQTSLSPFFDRAIRSTQELDYSPFSHVGLEVKFRVRESASDKGGTPPRLKPGDPKNTGWLGLQLKAGAIIGSVLKGSPAMEAGLYPDDEVIALDGYRVDGSTLIARCEDRRPGVVVKVTLARRERLMELSVTLGSKPLEAAYLARVENPTNGQKAAYRAWLDVDWDQGES